MRTVKIVIVLLLLLLPISGQSRRQPRGEAAGSLKYYLDITRPNYAGLSGDKWERIAIALKAKAIPAFFGLYETLDYREAWKPVKLRQTSADDGSLILGPFTSADAALKVLYRLPAALPKYGDRFLGVQAGVTDTPQTWQVGAYQIAGFKTREAVTVEKLTPRQSGSLEGVVVDQYLGASGYTIAVESRGIKYYVQMAGGGVQVKLVGDDTIGSRVRIFFRGKRLESNGIYTLNATQVVQIRK